MMPFIVNLFAAAVTITTVVGENFNILRHVGGNGQWFPGTFAFCVPTFLPC
jgi:hypothetical protein